MKCDYSFYFDVANLRENPCGLGGIDAQVSLCESFGSMKKAKNAYLAWLAFCDSEHPEAGNVDADPTGWIEAERKALEKAYARSGRSVPEGVSIFFED